MARDDWLRVALVENNPYDRAVIDVELEFDPNIELRYTIQGERGIEPLGPAGLARAIRNEELEPDIALLDLALDRESEIELAKTEFHQQFTPILARRLGLAMTGFSDDERQDLVGLSVDLAACVTTAGSKRPGTVRDLFTRTREWLAEHLPEERQLQFDNPDFDNPLETSIVAQELLTALWGGRDAADGAMVLSRARSLWGLFLLIVGNPGICFVIVSHYVNQATRPVLRNLLACRNPPSSFAALTAIYDPLVLSKSDLPGLAGKIREAYRRWQEEVSLHSRLAPFAEFPVLVPGNKPVDLRDVIEHWQDNYLRGSSVPQVLWDETAVIVSGKYSLHPPDSAAPAQGEPAQGWHSLFRLWEGQPICEWSDDRDGDRFLVHHGRVERASDAHSLADKVNNAPRSAAIFVFVRGDASSRREFLRRLSRDVELSLLMKPGESAPPRRSLWRRSKSWKQVFREVLREMPLVLVENEVQCCSLAGVPQGSETRRAEIVALRNVVKPNSLKEIVDTLTAYLLDDFQIARWQKVVEDIPALVRAAESGAKELEEAFRQRDLVVRVTVVG